MRLARYLACLRRSLALLAAVFFIFPHPGQAADLTLGGTGADLETMRVLGEAFEKANPGITIEVLPSLGSGGGIKALLAGVIDLALTARPLTKPQPLSRRVLFNWPTRFALVNYSSQSFWIA